MFGVAGGDVSGDALVESETREQAECSRQVDFAVAALLLGSGESGWPPPDF